MGSHIKIKNFSYSYNKKSNQLEDINLEIMPGEVVVLIGKSGCGKSSITRVINGLIPYFYGGKLEGEVYIDHKPISQLRSWEIGKLTGNVFQNPRSQFFANEVGGEVAFACENYGFNHKEIIQSVNNAAKEMGIENILMKSIHTLSYGMRQKVAIGSAQAINPEIYVMDEPSANLDIESTEMLAKMIKKLKNMGKTIIIAEHRLYYLSKLADRYLVIKDGRLVKEFTDREISELNENQLKNMGLRISNLNSLNLDFNSANRKNNIILEIENLSKNINGFQILDKVSFSCCEGEIIALIGPNGAGKSTLGKIISGLQNSSSGHIKIKGEKTKKRERVGNIWYIPQDLDSQLFGEDLLDELLTGLKKDDALINKAKNILKELDLIEYTDKHPTTLSGGQKQRLALGVALIYDAPIIILDEPTSGLDGFSMRRVSKIIKDISSKGKTVIIITHDAEFALNACERAIRLQNGKITDDFSVSSSAYLLDKMGYKDIEITK